jgi:hypothetical protein
VYVGGDERRVDVSEAQACRCAMLNALSGPAASEYARLHLDVTREVAGRTTTYLCPETGIEWVEERTPTAFNDDARRLRRLVN